MKPKFLFYAGMLVLLFGKPQGSKAQALIASGPTTFCQGGLVTLSVPLDTNVSYAWLRDTVLIAGQQSNLLTVTVSGSYRVIRNSVANCCDTSNSITVQVNPLPTASIQPSGTVTIFCGFQVPTISATPIAGASYQWYQNNVAITGAISSTWRPSSLGVYHVVVRDSNSCEQSSPTLTLIGGTPPSQPVLTYSSVPCTGQATLQCSVVPSGTTAYHWYRDDILIASTTSNSLLVTTPGHYNVKVPYTNNCPWLSSNYVQVIIYSAPNPAITTQGSTEICPGDSVILSVGSGYFVDWFRNGVMFASGMGLSSIKVTGPGLYTCMVTTWSPQGSGIPRCSGLSINSIQVSMKPNSIASISSSGPTDIYTGDSVILIAPDLPGLTCTWYRDNQVIVGETGNRLIARLAGEYYLKGRTNSVCISNSNKITIRVDSATLTNKLYPNPTSGKAYLAINEKASTEVTLGIYSIHGTIVKETTLSIDGRVSPIEIDLSSQNPGIYLLRIQQDSNVSYMRLVLDR